MKIFQKLLITTILTSTIGLQAGLATEQDKATPSLPNVSTTKVTEKTTVPEKTTIETVGHSFKETLVTIKSYSVEKRDQAVKSVKESLAGFDERIDKLEKEIKAKKAQWSKKVTEEKEEKLVELKKARANVASSYEKLKNSSAALWETTKNSFVDGYDKLGDKLDKLENETYDPKDVPQNGK